VRLAEFRSLRVVPLATLVALAACNVDSVTGPADPLSPSFAKGGGHKPPPPPPPPAPYTHTPILFVHGYNGSSSTWTTMVNRFIADGYAAAELVNFTYDYTKSNRTTAQLIKTKVDSILSLHPEVSQVNIITHSMGTISVRYYIDSLGGSPNVHAFAGLGATNHGTSLANFLFCTSCVEMRPGSTLLNHLNATDESPFAVGYSTWRSPCDEAVIPNDSPILAGLIPNIENNVLTACMSHSDLHEDATVYAQVRDFIQLVAP
jgi:triacylglycerol esterase/lipase EstA (alpha/beta hydrolase family)